MDIIFDLERIRRSYKTYLVILHAEYRYTTYYNNGLIKKHFHDIRAHNAPDHHRKINNCGFHTVIDYVLYYPFLINHVKKRAFFKSSFFEISL